MGASWREWTGWTGAAIRPFTKGCGVCKDEKTGKLRNSRQKKTLAKMLRPKTPNDMRPEAVKSLLRHMKYDLDFPGGSIMVIMKKGLRTNVHMPHGKDGGNQVKPGTIKDIISFMKDVKDIKDKR